MNMPPVTIELTPRLREHLERRVKETGADSISEYILMLIEADLDRGDPELERLLLEGVNSGTPIVADDAFWARLKSKTRNQAGQVAQ